MPAIDHSQETPGNSSTIVEITHIFTTVFLDAMPAIDLSQETPRYFPTIGEVAHVVAVLYLIHIIVEIIQGAGTYILVKIISIVKIIQSASAYILSILDPRPQPTPEDHPHWGIKDRETIGHPSTVAMARIRGMFSPPFSLPPFSLSLKRVV